MRDAFANTLLEMVAADEDIIFLTADLGFGVFDTLAKEFPKQYLNVGVAEQNMTGISTGLGLEGRKVISYSIANFTTLRCLEQVRNDAAYHNVNLTMVSSGGGFTYGALGMSHHATEDLAILRALPNVCVVAPSTAWETGYATRAMISQEGVGYLRIEKGGIQDAPSDESYELGKSIVMREGSDATFISCGRIIEECISAAEQLSQRGFESRILSMHTVKPIDRDAILRAAEETGLVVVVEEHNSMGGLGGAVAEQLVGSRIPCRFEHFALPDTYSSVVGDQNFLRNYYKIDAHAIVSRLEAYL